jgi:uncharacterized protein (UPF0248 family)
MSDMRDLINKMNKSLNEDYASSQIDPIIQSAQDSVHRAKIKINHEGTETNYIDISLRELKLIKHILSNSEDK